MKQGECLGLIGANGCGKTTLAKQLAGLYPIAKGSLVYAGSEGAVRTKRELMKRNYLCFQDPSSQIFSHSLESELVPKERLSDKDYLDKATDYLRLLTCGNTKINTLNNSHVDSNSVLP